MSQTTWRGIRLSGLLGGASLLLLSSSALADGPFVLHLAAPQPGIDEDGDENGTENAGAGVEQPTVTVINKADGSKYIVTIWMSSVVAENLEPNQCKCSSVRLTDAGPEIVADQILLTQNENTDRPCNHPHVISDGSNYAVWAYGYAENHDAQTQSYVQVLNEMCQPMTEPVRYSQDDNNNQGAPELRWVGDGYISAGYYDNNHARTYYRQLMLTTTPGVAIDPVNDSQTVIDPSNIGRPSIAQSGDYSLLCAAKGEERPPEDGVACAYINGKTGEVMWSNEVIAQSQPDNHIYFNQPSVVTLSPGRFALQVIQSTGNGKDTNVKGGSLVHLYVLQPTADGAGVKGHYDGGLIGSYQTHSAIVAGNYGVDGLPKIALMEAPITGNGVPLLTFIDYNAAAEQFMTMDLAWNQWVLGPTIADSGYLSNIYGNNPNTQGRDYMRAIGDVANPGAGKTGKFMPLVKSFFVLPYAGRGNKEAGEGAGDGTGDGTGGGLGKNKKNGLYLSFIPGHTLEPVEPSTPDIVGGGEGTSVPNPKPFDPGPGSSGGEDDDGSNGPGTAPATGTKPGGCACSTESSGSGEVAGLFALLGLGVLGASRRRRSRKES